MDWKDQNNSMITAQAEETVKEIQSPGAFDDVRDECIGYVFHGIEMKGRKAPGKNSNLLHFAHCNKLEKLATDQPRKVWFRTIRVAREHLDTSIGQQNWKWCKQCESEVTQKLLETEGYAAVR